MKKRVFRQVAAIPVRRGKGGKAEVLLVTSRETRRWVVPKGWPFAKLPDHEAAAREAWEEAGIRGTVGKTPFGSYRYDKRRRDDVIPVVVNAYLLEVTEEAKAWPEAKQRERAWFAPAKAAAAVEEQELKALLLRLP